ncbi:MAG: methyl-accepting chemotaxis protein [Spirochaetaceae bacterium]|nr:MAG: methyl-accepting chemotaxis protein [Spirochaetaceae bacterium]
MSRRSGRNRAIIGGYQEGCRVQTYPRCRSSFSSIAAAPRRLPVPAVLDGIPGTAVVLILQRLFRSMYRHVLSPTIGKRILGPILGVVLLALALNTFYAYRSQHAITLETMETVTRSNLGEMIRQIREAQDAVDLLTESLNTNYLRIARLLAAHIARHPPALEPEAMIALAEQTGIPEIHVSDSAGILVTGNVPDFFGYSFDSEAQSAAFMPAITDPRFSLAQEPTPRGVDAELFQYIGVARVDEPGIVQIGLRPLELEKLIASTQPGRLAAGSRFGREGFFLVTDGEGLILHHPEDELNGANLADLAWARPLLEEEQGSALLSIAGRDIFAAFRKIEGYRVVAMIPAGEFTGPLGRMRITLAGLLLIALSLSAAAVYTVVRRSILTPVERLNASLTRMAEGDLDCRLEITSQDEFGVIGEHFNAVVSSLESFTEKIRNMLAVLTESITALATYSLQTSATSSEQSSAVAEIMSTMEDVNTLSKAIEKRILEASETATGTQHTVNDGFARVKENPSKIEEIHNANTTTIQGITFLGEKIKNIGDIVNVINAIADQTKIIAFNAELEASSSGEGGENFQIVATEIRRLADSTVKATRDIRERITEIQASSDKLIVASREGTARIREGRVLTGEIQELFQDILATAETSGESTRQIAGSVNKQVSTFEQVLLAIQQISAGVNNITAAADNTAETAGSLDGVSDNLKQILSMYDNGSSE